MWIKFALFGFLVLRCAVSSSLPKPTNVDFSSINLRNVLQWSPGNGSRDDTHFTVEYGIYGKPVEVIRGKQKMWRSVRQCTDILHTWCDLSAETWDVEEWYFARVRAVRRKSSSKWVESPRFEPKTETVFGPPLVSVEIENNSAIITLKGPMRYPLNNHTLVLPMKAIYPQMSYELSILNTHLNQMQHIPEVSSPYKYQLMEYNTKYCFSAKSGFNSIKLNSKFSAWYCLTTPKDPVIEQLKKSLVGIVVPSLCICLCVVVIYLLYNYLSGKDQKSPYILKQPSFFPPPLKSFPEYTSLIVVSLISDEPPPHLKNQLNVPDPPPNYSSQNADSSQEPDDPSVDYGAVVSEEPQSEHNGGDNGNNQVCGQGQSAGAYAPQINAHLCQRWAQTGGQSHVTNDALAEVSTPQVHPQFQVPITLPSQSQVPNQSPHEEKECPGLFDCRNPKTSHLSVRLDVQKQKEAEKMDEKTTGSEEEGSERENIPLLSGYVRQNISTRPSVQCNQSGCSSVYCGGLTPHAAHGAEEEEGEKEGGSMCTPRKDKNEPLVLTQMDSGLKKEDLNGAGKDVEMYITRSELKVEGDLLLQIFEEGVQRGEATELVVDDVFEKWGLIVS